jgi:Fe-S oxidoreductase
MPKLKYEFMNQHYKSHRRPLRDYLFGYFHVAAKIISPFAPVANLFMEMNWSQKMIARTLEIAAQRPFPKFSSKKQLKRNTIKRQHAVIFLSDVFSHYIEPEVEDAAIAILNYLGYEVKVLSVIGAGASLLSKGFLDAAKRHAEKVLAEIQRLDGGAGLSVVGCEPPELYCLKHEYSSLLPNRRDEIKSITQRVWLVEEFILRVVNKADWDLKNVIDDEKNKRLTLHPHCHHRAEGPAADGVSTGVSATVEMLKMFGFDVDVIDAGCCGMAGTFGYDAEHYDLSMKVGELGVLPKVREIGDRELVSSGAACRMQIKQGANVDARHPLLLVRDCLKI